MRSFARASMILIGSVLVAFAVLCFAYGVLLRGGEQGLPKLGGWLIALGVLCAAVGTFLLVRFSRRRP